MFFPLLCPVLSIDLVCVQRAGHLLCLGCRRSAYVCALQKCRLSFTELRSRLSGVSGATWGREGEEQKLSADCSFGLCLSLGTHKPLYSQHVTQPCSRSHIFLLSFLSRDSRYESDTRAHTCTHTSYHFLYLLYSQLLR